MSEEERSPLLSPSSSLSSTSPTLLGSPPNTPPLTADDKQRRRKARASFIFVLMTESLERTAFYGLICNMFMFLNSEPMLWASYNAVFAILILNGLSYVMSIFGGWLADSHLGKFHTILGFFVVYLAGFVVWPLFYPYPFDEPSHSYAPEWCGGINTSTSISNVTTSSPNTFKKFYQEQCWWMVYLAFVVIALGYGVIRVNLIPFGAHQVSHEGPHAMRTYFNWFYWCINIGALCAYGAIGYVQQEISYFWGYVIPNIALAVAFLVFIMGSCFYKKQDPTGSPISTILKIFVEAFRICKRQRRRRDAEILTSDVPQPVPCCLDYAKVIHGGSYNDGQVDEIKMVGKIILVFMSMIPYWLVYYQMQTTFVWQALHMRLDFEKNGTREAADLRKFKVPASWLSLFNVVFILLMLPLLDRVIYPYLDRCGVSPSLRVRMLLGMCFSMMSVLVAGCIEKYRMKVLWMDDFKHIHWQKIRTTYYEAADISVLLQIPQYALIGMGEIFTSTAGLELAYIYAPRSLQSIIMSLFWFAQGIGALIGSATIQRFEGVWFPAYDYGNINCQNSDEAKRICHLNYYFYFIAGIQAFGILLFLLIAWCLDIGRPVPVRVQRQGHTLVRPQNNAGHGDTPNSAARWVPQTLVRSRPINRIPSSNDTN